LLWQIHAVELAISTDGLARKWWVCSIARATGLTTFDPADRGSADAVFHASFDCAAECAALFAGAQRARQLQAINAIAQQTTAVLDLEIC